MIIDRTLPLLKLAAAAGVAAGAVGAVGAVWLVKTLRAQKPRARVAEPQALRAQTRVQSEVPWGETV